MFSLTGMPPSSVIFLATWTDSWYQEFSGASVAMTRGLLAKLPPAYLAGESFGPSRFTPYSAASLATVVPSTARLQMYGRCWSCHVVDRYGSPKPTMWRRASASAYGSDVDDMSANALICLDTVSASASALSRPPPNSSVVLDPTPL